MKKIVDDLRLIYKCCDLYYTDNMTQQQICDSLGLSRATVSRMLRMGREQGIVRIEVINPINFDYGKLEKDLERKYGLKEVIIVDNQPLDTEEDKIQRLSEAGFDYLSHVFKDGDTIGLAMGYTLYNIANVRKTYDFDRQFLFVPLFGGISQARMGKVDVQANQIAMNFAQKFGGRYVQFLAPAVFQNEDVMKGFLQEKSVNYIYEYFDRLDSVVMGVGIPDRRDSTIVAAGYLEDKKMDEFVERGAIGDIALRIYNREGNMEPFREFNDKVASIPVHMLKKVKNRIGIAGGVDKVNAIKGAIRGKYINILITDIDCAQKML
ncbi:MAG: sugar-binding transcriptional regulator [Lachnospiraceae bacterium]|nr:sugar-binding transcriptional regulator [Lachnospiraceae bacterium]